MSTSRVAASCLKHNFETSHNICKLQSLDSEFQSCLQATFGRVTCGMGAQDLFCRV